MLVIVGSEKTFLFNRREKVDTVCDVLEAVIAEKDV
jgi:hypothetical protein